MSAVIGFNFELLFNETDYERQRKLYIERQRICNKSVFRLPNTEFRLMFRMHKDTFAELLQELTPHLKAPLRSDGVSIETQVASAVRLLAQGSYQLSVGCDFDIGLSQPSVSKTLDSVLAAINTVLCPKYIKFPVNDVAKNPIKTWFLQEYGIPNVIGVVDGTQVGIYPPFITNAGHPEHVYVNRKNFHAINVQVVVDHDYRILNINAKFPGSSHDSHIWKMSAVRQYLSAAYRNDQEWILGDSGYPLEPWLITPFADPTTDNEVTFNNLHSKARAIVERAIGLLKARWRCLCKQRMLHYSPTTASKIINACAALHNFCFNHNDALNDPFEDETEVVDEAEIQFGVNNALHAVGYENRQKIIDFFSQYI